MDSLRQQFNRTMEDAMDKLAYVENIARADNGNSAFYGLIAVDRHFKQLSAMARELTLNDPEDLGQAYEELKAYVDLVSDIPEPAFIKRALGFMDEVTEIGQLPVAVNTYEI